MSLPPPTTLPQRYRVRDVVIDPPVVLAPMEGVTDLPFRRLIRRIGGPGLTCTEFVASEGLKRGVGKMVEMARFDPDERPVSVQIYGRNPAVMAEAARIVEGMGATICDINMGCPSKKVCAHSGGSALMREPDLARDIVRAVREAIDIPLTVKMRSGFDPSQRNAPEIARICQDEGAEAITVHWRTRADKYGGARVIDKIAETVDAVDIPVIGNGDIVDFSSAAAMFRETGCAGVMVGRGAMRNPWALLQIAQHLRGEPVTDVTPCQRRDTLIEFVDTMLRAVPNDRYALGRAKQVARHFTRGLPYGAEARTRLLRSQDVDAFKQVATDYFDRLERYRAGQGAAAMREQVD